MAASCHKLLLEGLGTEAHKGKGEGNRGIWPAHALAPCSAGCVSCRAPVKSGINLARTGTSATGPEPIASDAPASDGARRPSAILHTMRLLVLSFRKHKSRSNWELRLLLVRCCQTLCKKNICPAQSVKTRPGRERLLVNSGRSEQNSNATQRPGLLKRGCGSGSPCLEGPHSGPPKGYRRTCLSADRQSERAHPIS